MATKIQKPLIWAKFGFQVDYDVANWYPSFGSHISCPNQRFLYFGGHFWFKMATIAIQNSRHVVQHVLFSVNIHFHWNLLMLQIDIHRLGAIYHILCLLRFLLFPLNEVSGDILCLLCFLLSPQTKFGNLLFLYRFMHMFLL
jgi:hypothetical protein